MGVGGDGFTRRLVCPQLCDWRKSDTNERLLTFCRLTDHIAGRLKGLFVLFAGNLVKPFADLLRQTHGSSAGESGFSLDICLLEFFHSCFL